MRWLKAVGTSLRGQRSSSRRYFNTKMEDLDMTGWLKTGLFYLTIILKNGGSLCC